MNAERIRKIVILGGGTAGWMTASALSRALVNTGVEVTLIESEDIGIVGVGEATIPTIHWFNQLVGLNDAEFMRETQAIYKLGIDFREWGGPGQTYFHPFGLFGAPGEGIAFYHRWIRARLAGKVDDDFEAFSIAAQLGRGHRFAFPGQDRRSLLSNLGYAYHFDASLYARYLRKLAEGRGIKRVEGIVQEIKQHPETGFVTSLTTNKGDTLEGDLFIDCSGFRGVLIEQTLKTGYDDWSHWLPCDRAWAVPSENTGDLHPYTRSTARAAGWQWRIPLQHRTGNGYVYSSRYVSDDEARQTLLDNLEGQALEEPRQVRFLANKRKKAWNKNVVAIGLASGFLEPLESTSIHFIQTGISRLLSLFPNRDCDPYTVEQYNRVATSEMEAARDFIVLHYHASRAPGAMWDHVRAAPIPEALAYKIEHFRRTGRIVIPPEELFREASWFAVFMGQGIRPHDYNPLTDAENADEAAAHLTRLKAAIAQARDQLPTYRPGK